MGFRTGKRAETERNVLILLAGILGVKAGRERIKAGPKEIRGGRGKRTVRTTINHLQKATNKQR